MGQPGSAARPARQPGPLLHRPSLGHLCPRLQGPSPSAVGTGQACWGRPSGWRNVRRPAAPSSTSRSGSRPRLSFFTCACPKTPSRFSTTSPAKQRVRVGIRLRESVDIDAEGPSTVGGGTCQVCGHLIWRRVLHRPRVELPLGSAFSAVTSVTASASSYLGARPRTHVGERVTRDSYGSGVINVWLDSTERRGVLLPTEPVNAIEQSTLERHGGDLSVPDSASP